MEYTGYYGAEGYTLLAMESDSGEARHERRYICLLNNGSMPNGKGCRYNLNEYCCLLIKGTWGKRITEMYNVGICDDDKVFCAELEEMIRSAAGALHQKIETEVWYSGESIMQDLEKMTCPDILFLDIELYEKSGIDVGKFIRDGDDYVTHIVYVSFRQEYAMQLFRLQPLDFLIKPVSEGQVREVLERSMKQRAQGKALFEYQKGGVFYQVPCRNILYFMSSDKKISMATREGVSEFYGKLKDVAEKLPAGFIMIHQSYIINSGYAAEYTYETVKMQDGSLFSISKPYRKAVRGRIKELEKERLHVGI